MTLLLTGAAGFIGAALGYRLLQDGHTVIGIDNFNAYYDPALKEARVKRLQDFARFTLIRADCANQKSLFEVFKSYRPRQVVHLAAQAGVRYSFENPQAYIDANITGFLNILEACRHFGIEHLLYASSSSVYGAHQNMPFSEKDAADHPLSLYGATKRANELMAHAYSANFNIPTTGIRFFTVYGPWGRPDMALFKFTKLFWQTSLLKFITVASINVISPISTMLSKPWCVYWISRRGAMPNGTLKAPFQIPVLPFSHLQSGPSASRTFDALH